MPLAAPAVIGSTAVGSTLTCAPGRWSGSPTGYEIRWNRGNAPILNKAAGHRKRAAHTKPRGAQHKRAPSHRTSKKR